MIIKKKGCVSKHNPFSLKELHVFTGNFCQEAIG